MLQSLYWVIKYFETFWIDQCVKIFFRQVIWSNFIKVFFFFTRRLHENDRVDNNNFTVIIFDTKMYRHVLSGQERKRSGHTRNWCQREKPNTTYLYHFTFSRFFFSFFFFFCSQCKRVTRISTRRWRGAVCGIQINGLWPAAVDFDNIRSRKIQFTARHVVLAVMTKLTHSTYSRTCSAITSVKKHFCPMRFQ